MKVKILKDFTCFDGRGDKYVAGHVVTVGDVYGGNAIKQGLAEEVADKPETSSKGKSK